MTDHVLYRKYRPKDFDEVQGQPHVVKVLKNALKLDRVAHAYLFSGPRGTGKTSVARILARAINCQLEGSNPSSSMPCNSCQTCNDFLTGRTLDLVELDAASNRGIDEIRAICDAANFLPVSASRKVYIIDEVHMLTPPAFNALLKTLEEPPKHVVFILATTEPEKVPETISSRTQHLRFGRVSDEITARAILDVGKAEGFEIESEAAQTLALFSEGSLRDALNLLGQVSVLSGVLEDGSRAGRRLGLAVGSSFSPKGIKNIGAEPERSGAGFVFKITTEDVREFFGAPASSAVLELVSAVGEKDAKRAFEILRSALKNGSDPRIFMKILIHDFRNKFLGVLNGGHEEQNFPVDRLERILLVLLDASSARFYSPHRELPLELAVSRIIRET